MSTEEEGSVHVFHMDMGEMLVFEASLHGANVTQLHRRLQQNTGIPANTHVLFANGGVVLQADKPVNSYSGAGTFSNPIFFVNRACDSWTDLPQTQSPAIMQLVHAIKDCNDELCQSTSTQECGSRQLHWAAVIAQEVHNAKNESQKLIDEQHLLYQGWQSLLSNLDDTCVQMGQRYTNHREAMGRAAGKRVKADQLLTCFEEDKLTLTRLPVPSVLCTTQHASLWHWMSSQTNVSPSDASADLRRHLDRLRESDGHLVELQGGVKEVMNASHNQQYRVIAKITERFEQMDKHLNELAAYTESIVLCCEEVQEAHTAHNIRAQSSIKEHYRRQQEKLLQCLQKLQEILGAVHKFASSKFEVLVLIRNRLQQWLIPTHAAMLNCDGRITIGNESIRAFNKRLFVIRQVHDAPQLFAQACAEIMRRLAFRQEYSDWTRQLTTLLTGLLGDENAHRKQWRQRLSKHFLRALFECLAREDSDVPPFSSDLSGSSSSSQCGQPFDDVIPQIGVDQLRQMRSAVPSLGTQLRVRVPNITERLTIVPPNVGSQSIMDYSGGQLCRAPSFIDNAAHSINPMGSTATLYDDVGSPLSPLQGMLLQTLGRERTTSLPSVEGDRIGDRPSPALSDTAATVMAESTTSTATAKTSTSTMVAGNGSTPIQIPMGRQISEHYGTPPSSIEATSPNTVLVSMEHVSSLSSMDSGGKVSASSPFVMTASPPSIVEPTSKERTAKEEGRDVEVQTERENIDLKEKLEAIYKAKPGIMAQIEEMKCDLAAVRDSVTACASSSGNAPSVHDIEQRIDHMLKSVKSDAYDREKGLRDEMDKTKAELQKLQEEVIAGNAKIAEKSENMADLERSMAKTEEEHKEALHLARAEILRITTVDYELQMDDMNRSHEQQLRQREDTVARLQNDVHERENTIASLKREQESIVARMIEAGSSPTSTSPIPIDSCGQSPGSASPTAASPSATMTARIRSELEKDFRGKFEVLTRGLKEQQNDALLRLRKEHEIEIRMLNGNHQNELNRCRIAVSPVTQDIEMQTSLHVGEERPQLTDSECQATVTSKDCGGVQTDVVDVVDALVGSSSTVAPLVDAGSGGDRPTTENVERASQVDKTELHETKDMETSQIVTLNVDCDTQTSPMEDDNEVRFENETCADVAEEGQQSVDAKEEEEDTVAVIMTPEDSAANLMEDSVMAIPPDSESSSSVKCQTRLRLRDFDHLIDVGDQLQYHVGAAVMCVYSETMKHFVLFTTCGHSVYAIKERCWTALRLNELLVAPQESSTSTSTPDRRFVIGRLEHVEACMIKKEENRYKLKMGTKFWRVAVVPVEGVKGRRSKGGSKTGGQECKTIATRNE